MDYSWIDAAEAKASLSLDLVAWARTQPDFETAWSACGRVDWLVDLGLTFELDDASQRALVVAAADTLLLEPTFLRLRPVGFRIAEAWALRRDAEYLDPLNTRRYDDYKNATLVYLPIALTAILAIQYRTAWPRGVRQLIAVTGVAATHFVARAWGIARVWLTRRAIRNYRFEKAERDVFRPAREQARQFARRLGPDHEHVLVDKFRRGWKRVADLPVPQVRT